MFETERFKAQLTAVISREAGNSGLKEYEPEVVNYLQRLASENESTLMQREVRKAASEQRGLPDALVSAQELAREASKYAAEEKRPVLRLSDVQKAVTAKFCQVWPFCKQ